MVGVGVGLVVAVIVAVGVADDEGVGVGTCVTAVPQAHRMDKRSRREKPGTL
jgi:hypothetical protein